MSAVPGDVSQQRVAREKITVPHIRARKTAGPPLVVVTAYDFTMARLLDQADVDILLVGDSLGMVVQGHSNTLAVTLGDICYHGRCVARSQPRAHLVGDMPFLACQISAEQAIRNAGAMLQRGAFESVKVEGGRAIAGHIERLTQIGIPVMGHLGLQPQSVHAAGGFRLQIKTAESARRLVADARALESAGVYAIVLEAVPPDVAAAVTRAVRVPTIGIGSGGGCDGQVLVCTDLLGFSLDPGPRFVKRYAEIGATVVDSVRSFARDVRAGSFPGKAHAYRPLGSTRKARAPSR